jgi:hypothetical protein
MKKLNNNTNYPMLPEGIRVEESHLIQEGRIIHSKQHNLIQVSDDGTIYKVVFLSGINDKSVNCCIDIATRKVNKDIQQSAMKAKKRFKN